MLLSASEASISPSPSSSNRNKVLDLLRGHYLLAILIDHFNRFPSVFELYNAKGNLWVSAATGFVFMSGYLIGLVSFSKIQKYGFLYTAKSLLRRGIKLHLINIVLTMLYSQIGLWAGGWPQIGDGIRYSSFWERLINAIIFRYSYGWADLLVFYSILILLSPPVIWFIYRGYWKSVLVGSFCLWLFGFLVPGTQRVSASYFSLISWQFMFVIGIVVAYKKSYFSTLYRSFFVTRSLVPKITLTLVFVLSVVLSYLDVYKNFFIGTSAQIVSIIFNKIELGPGRLLLFFVWFVFFYTIFLYIKDFLIKYFGWVYLTFGENSLLTYIVQSIVLFASYYIKIPYTYSINTLYTFIAVVVTVVLVKFSLVLGKRLPKF